jgi:hypothetical protein
MDCSGPGKLKSKPNIIKMFISRSISFCFVTYFFSSSFNKEIILVKLGEIGYSSFAAIKILIVAKHTV